MSRVRSVLVVFAVLATLFSLAPVGAPSASAATGFSLERLAGANRYETAAKVAIDAFPSGSADVVLATGRSFPDALAGAFLSGERTGAILLTDRDSLHSATANALSTLKTQRVTILGGPSAVSSEVEAAIAARNSTAASGGKIQVTRIAGSDRYETAALVATAAGTTVGTISGKRTAVIARGDGFADALAASPLAWNLGLPIILTTPNGLHPDAKATLQSRSIEQVLIMGGTAAISSATEDEIQDARGANSITTLGRFAGSNRQETARLLAEYTLTTPVGFSDELITLARGDDFPDALAGGPHGGTFKAPLLLTVSPTQLSPNSTSGATRYLKDHSDTLTGGVVLGGTGAVSNGVVNEATAAGTGQDTVKPTIVSATANAVNEVVVLQYSEKVACNKDTFKQFTFTGATPAAATAATCPGTNQITLNFTNVTASGQVSYADPNAEIDADDVADLAGNTAANQTIAAALAADAAPPKLVSALANTATDIVQATFSTNVTCDNSQSQFTFQSAKPTSATCSNKVATLQFGDVTPDGPLTLSYADDNKAAVDANDVKDAVSGAPADDGTVTATRTGDAAGPIMEAAFAEETSGLSTVRINIRYNEPVTCSDASAEQFTYSNNPLPTTLSAVCYGNWARIELPFILDGTGNVVYTPGAEDIRVRDLSGNPQLAGSVAATVMPDTAGPLASGSGVSNAAPDVVKVQLDRPVQCLGNLAGSITYATASPTAVNCPVSNGLRTDAVWLYLAAVTEGGSALYDDPEALPDGNDLIDGFGNPAADNLTQTAAGTADELAPAISSFVATLATKKVDVTFSENVTCDDSAALRSQFSYEGASPTSVLCDVSGGATLVTLNFAAMSSTSGALNYVDGVAAADADDVRDMNGNSATNFAPPTITSIAINTTTSVIRVAYSTPVSCGDEALTSFGYSKGSLTQISCPSLAGDPAVNSDVVWLYGTNLEVAGVLTYTKPAAGTGVKNGTLDSPSRTIAAPTTSAHSVPTVQSVAVDDINDVLTFTFSENVMCDQTSVSAFTFVGGNPAGAKVSCATALGTPSKDVKVTVTSTTGLTGYSYNAPTDLRESVRSLTGGPAASYDKTGPTMATATVPNGGSVITVTWNEPVTCGGAVGQAAHYTLAGISPVSVTCNGTSTVVLTFAAPIASTTPNLFYDDLGNVADNFVRDTSPQANKAQDGQVDLTLAA